jgi:hypothetical protein
VKLIWIGAFVLVFASMASLISNRQNGRLINESWASFNEPLPVTRPEFLLGCQNRSAKNLPPRLGKP